MYFSSYLKIHAIFYNVFLLEPIPQNKTKHFLFPPKILLLVKGLSQSHFVIIIISFSNAFDDIATQVVLSSEGAEMLMVRALCSMYI